MSFYIKRYFGKNCAQYPTYRSFAWTECMDEKNFRRIDRGHASRTGDPALITIPVSESSENHSEWANWELDWFEFRLYWNSVSNEESWIDCMIKSEFIIQLIGIPRHACCWPGHWSFEALTLKCEHEASKLQCPGLRIRSLDLGSTGIPVPVQYWNSVWFRTDSDSDSDSELQYDSI